MQIDPQKQEKEILIKLIQPQDKIVLEIGCGEGRTSLLLAKLSDYYIAIDSDEKAITKARSKITQDLGQKIEFKVQKSIQTGLSDKSVDIVLMLLCFHEITFDEQCPTLVEAYRVLKKGGKLIIIDPEENPTNSVQALYNLVYSYRNFDHSKIVSHSKSILADFIRKQKINSIKKMEYSLWWKFDSYDDLISFMIKDNPEIQWNQSNKQKLQSDIKKFSLNIEDKMEVIILNK